MNKILAVSAREADLAACRAAFLPPAFELREARGAPEAAEAFREFAPQLLVLEAGMAAGGGLTVFERLRALFPGPLPVIFLRGPQGAAHVPRIANSAALEAPPAEAELLAETKRLLRLP